MIMAIQFSSRQDKVASLRGRLQDLDAQVRAQETRIKARESEIRSLQVEQAQRSDKSARSLGFPAPKSRAGQEGLHQVACKIVNLKNEIIDIKGAIRRLDRQRKVILSEIRYEENILEASAPRVYDRRPVQRI